MRYFPETYIPILLLIYWLLGPGRVRRMRILLEKGEFTKLFQRINNEKKRLITLADKKEILYLEGIAYYYLGDFKTAINVFSIIKIERVNISLYKKIHLFILLSLYFDNQYEQYLTIYNNKEKVLNNSRGNRKVNFEIQILKAYKFLIEDDLHACRKVLSKLLSEKDPFKGKHITGHYCLGLLYEKTNEKKLAREQYCILIKECPDYAFLKKLAIKRIESI